MNKILAVVVVLAVGAVTWIVSPPWYTETPPKLDPNEWWGPKELRTKQDISVRPFQVKFTEEIVKDLKARLKNHRELPPPLDGVGFKYGFNSEQLGVWSNYWANEYQFSKREKFLNKYPQYKTNIQGLDIHFIRVRPQVPSGVKVLPILLMHGWPGSVREFYEAIPLLTKQKQGYNFAFEVIVPSLPGYGFSDASVRPGLGPVQMGVIFKNLMNRLGYKKFYIQGGDWGALIASMMATMFPESILGHHSNMLAAQNSRSMMKTLIGAFVPHLIVEPHLAGRMYPLSSVFAFFMEEFGYFHLQATKPDTIGTALSDSPVGLLAYILEKFSSWTVFDNRGLPDGGLHKSFTKDQLLDNLMLYWCSNSITTSMRLYAESMSNDNRGLNMESYHSTVPTWALQAKNELLYQPPNILKTKHLNLLGVTVLDEGGHFIAFEKPQLFADDVFKAVQEFIKYHNMKTEL